MSRALLSRPLVPSPPESLVTTPLSAGTIMEISASDGTRRDATASRGEGPSVAGGDTETPVERGRPTGGPTHRASGRTGVPRVISVPPAARQ